MYKRGKKSRTLTRYVNRYSLVKDARSQFYIIAVVIMIAVIIGITGISNYVRTKPVETKIYDIGEEFGLETGNVIDYGIYNEKDIDILIENWTEQYYEYSRAKFGKSDWVLVYGNKTNMVLLTFTETNIGEIEVNIGGVESSVTVTPGIGKEKTYFEEDWKAEDQIGVVFLNTNYDFKLKKGENFFFVIKIEENVISN